jgi:hypothetical protein
MEAKEFIGIDSIDWNDFKSFFDRNEEKFSLHSLKNFVDYQKDFLGFYQIQLQYQNAGVGKKKEFGLVRCTEPSDSGIVHVGKIVAPVDYTDLKNVKGKLVYVRMLDKETEGNQIFSLYNLDQYNRHFNLFLPK